MDTVGVNVIETAALGRPFQLGMLYDCRKDALIPGITLWDPEKLQQSLRVRPQTNTDFKVTASDSIQDKSSLLNIDGSLKLSVLVGLINVEGSAKYLKDTKKSFRQQRLTLHYHSTSRFEELTMNHLASAKIVHHEVFDNDTATHVVTAVLYGADACFVFDREVSSDEKIKTVEGEAKVAFEKLKLISVDGNINLQMNDTQKNAAQKFTCMFYGDFQLPSNPTTLEDALKVFSDLPNLLGEKNELAVPLRVWLYPLDKLLSKASKLQKDISMDLIIKTESVIEILNTTEMKCSDLLEDSPALTFAEFQDKILQMKQNCSNYNLRLINKLGSLLPNIRGDVMKETDLNDLLQDHNKSPFSERVLAQWLKERERESVIIKSVLRQLKDAGAQVEDNIDLILMDLEVGNLVSYTFTSLNWSDVLLYKQTTYLSNSTKGETDENGPDSEQKSWLTPEMQKTLRSNLKIFKNLTDSKDCEPAKFIVSSKEMKNNPGSCILLYESECDEAVCFIPPSKPACPMTEEVKDNSVVLKVPPSCPETVELRLLYKPKDETDWRSKPVMKDENTVTLTDLRAGTEYEIKWAALGKLNYNVYSDVISVTTESLKTQEPREDHFQSLSMNTEKTDSTDMSRRYCGLENPDSTSYLNAVLQTLFMTKDFREHIKSLDRDGVSSDGNLAEKLQKLFNKLEMKQERAVSPAEIMKSLGITDVHKEQDAGHLLRLILTKTPGSSELFKGIMKTTGTCRSCRNKPEQISKDFLSLILTLRKPQDVEQVLQTQTSENKRVYCDHCRMTDMETKTEMMFSEHMVIHLKRSEMTNSSWSSSKNDQEVIIRPHIKVSSHSYELYAVLNYDGGRYNVHIKCEDEIWHRFDDCRVLESDLNSIFINESSTLRSSDPCLLVYRRREQTGETGDERNEDQRLMTASKLTQPEASGKSLKSLKPREDHFQSLSMNTKKTDSTDKRRRYCWLENQGSTCYLNAVLHTLFMTKEFREHVKSASSGDTFIKELKELFSELETQQERAVSAAGITKNLGIDVYKQQDAAELLHLILIKTPGSFQLFKGTKKTTGTCRSCRNKPEQISKYFHSLIITLQKPQDVEQLLQTQTSENKRVYCDHCRMTDMESKTETMFSEHMVIQLKRFEMTNSSWSSSKNDQEVIIRPHIKVSSHSYELYAVLNYDGGRYNVHIKCEDEIWHRFDDCRVLESDLNSIFINESSTLRSSDAYLLVYRRRE